MLLVVAEKLGKIHTCSTTVIRVVGRLLTFGLIVVQLAVFCAGPLLRHVFEWSCVLCAVRRSPVERLFGHVAPDRVSVWGVAECEANSRR